MTTPGKPLANGLRAGKGNAMDRRSVHAALHRRGLRALPVLTMIPALHVALVHPAVLVLLVLLALLELLALIGPRIPGAAKTTPAAGAHRQAACPSDCPFHPSR